MFNVYRRYNCISTTCLRSLNREVIFCRQTGLQETTDTVGTNKSNNLVCDIIRRDRVDQSETPPTCSASTDQSDRQPLLTSHMVSRYLPIIKPVLYNRSGAGTRMHRCGTHTHTQYQYTRDCRFLELNKLDSHAL